MNEKDMSQLKEKTMSSEEENAAVVNYDGYNEVKIVNGRPGPGAITDVRVMHFAKDLWTTELLIEDKMASGEGKVKTFHSIGGSNDHWAVTFQEGPNGYMSKDLDKSMAAGESYILTIGPDNLTFQRADGTNSKTSRITYLYDCIKS